MKRPEGKHLFECVDKLKTNCMYLVHKIFSIYFVKGARNLGCKFIFEIEVSELW